LRVESGLAPAEDRDTFYPPAVNEDNSRPRDPLAGANLFGVKLDTVAAVLFDSHQRRLRAKDKLINPPRVFFILYHFAFIVFIC
jgi:hypothetical protein